MSSLRRLIAMALGSGTLAALLCLPLLDAAGQQKDKGADPKKPAEAKKKESEFTDALTLPTKREAKTVIDATEYYIQASAWAEVCQLLQSLLEEKEDNFVQVKRVAAGGEETQVWTSVRAEANRQLGQLPQAAMETYEVLYGARGRKSLAEAREKGDIHLLGETANRYFHTEAGAEATSMLGTYHLDRGNAMMAALCFERLIQRLPANKVPPLTLFKAFLAHRRLNDPTAAEGFWKMLTARVGREGLKLGEKAIPLEQLRAEVERLPAAILIDSSSVAMFRVDASRSGHSQGSVPYLKRRWEMSMLPREDMKGYVETKQNVANAISQAERSQNVLPGNFPIAANNRLIFRTYWGIYAVNARTGEREWYAGMRGSLESLTGNHNYRPTIQPWLTSYTAGNLLHHVLLENSTLGTMSTDLSRVYVVDDLAVPPHANNQNPNVMNQGMLLPGGLPDLVRRSYLMAYDLDSGKLLWELGGDRDPKELQDCFFLGAPLPLAGKLYLLVEHNGELRLVCLDPPKTELATPAILWMQTLATTQVKLAQDPGRRIQAANLAYGDGILVCPTNAGAVLGVDLLTRSLLWAYPYREGQVTEMRGDRAFGRAVPILPVKAPEWKASAPIIQDGRVIFTAPDAASIHCLRLRDGTRLWKAARGDDLFLAGVFKEKVVLVGKTHIRALSAANATPLWTLEVGQPAGQGVCTGQHYYLPIKKPVAGVCKIDIQKGEIVSTSRCRDEESLGNLVYYDGDVISQNEQWVRAYPQLEAEIARLDREIEKAPTNATHLAERGELRLDHGNLKGAIDDLSKALKNNPPESLVPKTRDKLYDTLTELLQRDFDSAEPHLAQYEQLCKVDVPANAEDKVREEAQKQERHRRAKYWGLLARGREGQGRIEEAFKAYLEYGGLTGPDELLPVVGQIGVKARSDVWAQGRIVALLEKAGAGPRKALESEIAARWETVRKSGDTPTLRSFVSTFGSFSASAGREGRLQLAERLLQEKAFTEAEMQLFQLRNQRVDAGLAAQATEALARLMMKRVTADRVLLQDAAHFYRSLGREYVSLPIRDTRTGLDFFNEAAAIPLILPHLDEPSRSLPRGEVKSKELPGTAGQPQTRGMIALSPRGEALPFFERFRVGISMQDYHTLRVEDRDTGEERWSVLLDRTTPAYLNNPTLRPSYYLVGHVAVVFHGHLVYGFDLLERKKLWQKSLLGLEAFNPQANIYLDHEGLFFGVPSSNTRDSLGMIGPVTAAYVCLLTREGLVAIEPATGSVLWTKSDVPSRTLVFGDEEYVYLVDARDDGGSTARAVRGKDGTAVEVPEFAKLFNTKNRPRFYGRHLLVSEAGPKESLIYRLYDIRTGKDLWKKEFAANSLRIRSESHELTGVLEPNGAVTLINLKTGRLVFHPEMVRPEHLALLTASASGGFPANLAWTGLGLNGSSAKPATVLASHMQKGIQDVLLLEDADQFYFILNDTPPPNAGNPNNPAPPRPLGPFANVQSNIRHTIVSGFVYAFHKNRGVGSWHMPIPSQMLILERFEEMPVLLFTARITKQQNQGGITQTLATMSIEKRTGKRKYDKDNYQGNAFHALKVDRRTGTVDLVGHNLTLRHYIEGADSGGATGGAGGAAGPNPGDNQAEVPPPPPPRRPIVPPPRKPFVPPPKKP